MADIPIAFGGGGGSGSDDVTASKNQVLAGYTAITTDSGDEPVEGTIPTKATTVYNTSTSDQVIAANQYLGGDQFIRGVATSNIDAGNIKKGVVVKVGDANDAGRIKNVTGTYTTVSSGQTAVTAAAMLSGYSGFAEGGSEVQGSISSLAATTYNTSTSDQTIAASQYLSGTQTIRAVTTANIDAGNIKKGVVVKVGDENDAGRIKNITGTYTTITSGQTGATAGSMLSGYSAFSNGGDEVKGTISSKAAATYTATTSNQTINAGQYLSGAQTIAGNSNLVAGNILSGKTIFNVSGSFVSGAQRVKSGAITSSADTLTFVGQSLGRNGAWDSETNYGCYYYSISNIGFAPSYMYTVNNNSKTVNQLGYYGWWEGGYWMLQSQTSASGKLYLSCRRFKNTGNLSFTSSLVRVPYGYASTTQWYILG